MKRLAIFASVVLFGLPCWCNVRAQAIPWKKNSTDGLFRISDNFKDGYIDSTGKIVIPPQFDEARDFSEGLAAVRVCTKYGYVDTSGKMIIEPQFQFAEPFSDGLAQVQLSTNEVAYVDRSGKIAFTLQAGQVVQPFSEGLAAANLRLDSSSGTRGLGFIDKTGHYAIPSQFDQVLGRFSEGLATVVVGNKFGFIDLSGKYVAEPQFDEAGWFSEGRAPVKLGVKWGFIDKTGTMVVPPKFDAVDPFFSDGLIEVKVGDKWGFSDPMGNAVISAKFDGPTESVPIAWFSGGLAPVRVGQNWGFVDRTGKMVIEPRLDLIAPFTNGLTMATIDEKEFYIDKTGKPVRLINETPFAATNMSIPPGSSVSEILLSSGSEILLGRKYPLGGSERLDFVSMSEKVSQRLLKLQVPPVYPERARAARLEGTVVLRAAINADGNVEAVRVVSGDPLLTAAASDAAKEWRYEPFLYQCKPVPVSTQITVEFKLPRP